MNAVELQRLRLMARAHCAHCSTSGREVYHFDTRCPTENRERPVSCAFATIAQAKAGRHTTFQDDGICDRCLGARRARVRCADCARPAAESRPSAAAFSADALTSAGTAATRVRETGPGEASPPVRPGPVLSSGGM